MNFTIKNDLAIKIIENDIYSKNELKINFPIEIHCKRIFL